MLVILGSNSGQQVYYFIQRKEKDGRIRLKIIMKIYERIKLACRGVLLSGFICFAATPLAYAAGASYGVQEPAGHGDIRFYTDGFTVHRVYKDLRSKTKLTNKESSDAYGQYSQAYGEEKTSDGKPASVTGSYTFGNSINETKYGAADYNNYSIVPFRDNKSGSSNGVVSLMLVAFQPEGYMQKSLAMQDGELWKDYFTAQELQYDDAGNVLNDPVIFECNGIISLLSRTGALRDQYALQSPEDGWWFLGGSNPDAGIFYGHQYTLWDNMIPAFSPTSETGGWYYNRDGVPSEKYNKEGGKLWTTLSGNRSQFDARMRIRFFKCFSPIDPQKQEEDPDNDLGIWEETGEYGRDFPEVYTYNTSDEFNLGQGIPSGESFTNGFLTNKWFGTYGWGRTRRIKKTFTVSHPIHAQYEIEHTWEDDDGDVETWYETVDYYPCPTVTTTREAYYYGVRSADIYEFKDADISNGSYGIPPHYTNPSEMPVSLTINESAISTYKSIYDTNVDNHIRFYPESGSVTRPHEGIVDTGDTRESDAYFIRELNLQEQDDHDSGIYVVSHNDELSVNNKVYMDPAEHSSHDRGQAPEMDAPVSINVLNINTNPDSGGDFKCITGEVGIDIPAGVRNGKYTTSFISRYLRRTPRDNELQTVEKSGKEATYNPYDNNEPVVVHTPVISPVKIIDPETETQLATQPPSNISSGETLYKLWLDGTYTLEFQPEQWFSNEFGELLGYENSAMEADRYDRYVKQKLVKFPFEVTIIEPSGSRHYYPLASGGYTDWIAFPDMVNTMQFYVPSWVKENHTKWGNNNAPGNVYDIKFRVEAQNVEGDTGEDESEEDTLNSLLENHVATYDIFANVSGLIYGFEIVGINDRDMFAGYSDDINETSNYSFALNLEEKKASTKNRFGKPYQRFTLTGEATDSWNPQDTLPLRPGSSHRYSSMGTIWKGTDHPATTGY